MVLPFLCHKKHLNYKNKKFFFSKLRLNLVWHCAGALIFPDFSCFVKLHTLGKMGTQFAFWSIGNFLHESLPLTPVLTIRIIGGLPLLPNNRISIAAIHAVCKHWDCLVLTTQQTLHSAVSAHIFSKTQKRNLEFSIPQILLISECGRLI